MIHKTKKDLNISWKYLNRRMRQTKKDLFEIIRQQSEVIEYWMEKALESDLKLIHKEGSIAENE